MEGEREKEGVGGEGGWRERGRERGKREGGWRWVGERERVREEVLRVYREGEWTTVYVLI